MDTFVIYFPLSTALPKCSSYVSINVCGRSEKKSRHNMHTFLYVKITAKPIEQKHVLGRRYLNTDLHHLKELPARTTELPKKKEKYQ